MVGQDRLCYARPSAERSRNDRCARDYYDGVFGRDDFERMADQLAGIAGRFVLSINGTAGAREVFGRFTIDEVETTWTISTATPKGATRVRELIVQGGGASGP